MTRSHHTTAVATVHWSLTPVDHMLYMSSPMLAFMMNLGRTQVSLFGDSESHAALTFGHLPILMAALCLTLLDTLSVLLFFFMR